LNCQAQDMRFAANPTFLFSFQPFLFRSLLLLSLSLQRVDQQEVGPGKLPFSSHIHVCFSFTCLK